MKQDLSELTVQELIDVAVTNLRKVSEGGKYIELLEHAVEFQEIWLELWRRGMGVMQIYKAIREEDK